ncbi:hypothetical protein [Endozoicomonas sp. 4G]|uniref:hypothetical protein n=1 Tax=Endozoicomonas sp. 4G TaxID=2872754 RepID=UPI0020789728|nr:hypothetical protein [Endozoicomonas sp. 4G]
MLRQNINRTFSSVFLVVSLSLCPPNALCDNATAKVEFIQWLGPDLFIVTASPKECINYVTPGSLLLFPGIPQTMTIHYFVTGPHCSADPSIEQFEVRNFQQPDKVARFKWTLQFASPTLSEIYDPDKLLSFYTKYPYDIVVSIVGGGQSQQATSNSN